MVGVLNIDERFLQKMWTWRLECPCDTQNCPQAGTMVSSGLAAVGLDVCSANKTRLELQKSPPQQKFGKQTFWTTPWSVYIIYTHSCMYIYIYVYSTRIFFWFMSFCHILTVRKCIPGSTPNLRVSLQCQLVRERYDEDSMMDRWPTPSTNNMEVTNNRSWVDFELRLDSNSF